MIQRSVLRPIRQSLAFDRGQVDWFRGGRNAVGVGVPLIIAVAVGHPLVGVGLAIGALNVSFSDREVPYRVKTVAMASTSASGAISCLIGGLVGANVVATSLLSIIWGCLGGIAVIYGPLAEQAGLTSIVLFVVYSGLGLTPPQTLLQVVLIFAGGCLQTVLSIAPWPARRRDVERRQISTLFHQLATYARRDRSALALPASGQTSLARQSLSALAGASEGEDLRLLRLLDQAELLRLTLVAFEEAVYDLDTDSSGAADGIEELLLATAHLLDVVGAAVVSRAGPTGGTGLMVQVEAAVGRLTHVLDASHETAAGAVLVTAGSLLAQSRTLIEDIGHAETSGETGNEIAQPYSLDLALGTLISNLTLQSTAFRHAIRLAATVALAILLGRYLGFSRPYWIPLTAAIVLKPDYTATLTRGFLRIAGTMVGLGLATGLALLCGNHDLGKAIALACLVFVVRAVGAASFGLVAAGVTAMVVLLVSYSGTAPSSVIHFRAIDTLIGGALALAVYVSWPTWENRQIWEFIGITLDRYRYYFDLIAEGLASGTLDDAKLTRARQSSRLARSNAEASLARMANEPAGDEPDRDLARRLLDSSTRLARSMVVIEAESRTVSFDAQHSMDSIGRAVDLVLSAIALALKGNGPLPSRVEAVQRALRDLREMATDETSTIDLGRLVENISTLVQITDRAARRNQTRRTIMQAAIGRLLS